MSQERYGVVECPRCGKIWHLQWGSPGVECVCHLFCSSGTKPSDCAVTYPVNLSNQPLGYPAGAHNNTENEGNNIFLRSGYCSTHGKYTNKEPIWLEVNWTTWENERLPPHLRLLKQ